jgi:hypothetical protein
VRCHPLVAASKIFEATWVRVPVWSRETLSQTSSRTARKSAVVTESNMRDPQVKNYFTERLTLTNPRMLIMQRNHKILHPRPLFARASVAESDNAAMHLPKSDQSITTDPSSRWGYGPLGEPLLIDLRV